jgi:hypothetical protein
MRADIASLSLSDGTAVDVDLIKVTAEDESLSVGAPGADFTTPEVAEVETALKSGAGSDDDLTAAEDVGGRLGLHIEADSIAYRATVYGASFKKVRKAESMGITTAEPLEVPEKKMRRADGELLVGSEAASANETATTPRPPSWDSFSKSQKANWRRKTRRSNK